MSVRGMGSVCVLLLVGVLAAGAQDVPSAPQPQPSAGQSKPASPDALPDTSSSRQTAQEQQGADDPSSDQKKTDQKPPSKLKRVLNRAKPNCAHVGASETCWDKNPREKEEEQKRRDADGGQSTTPRNQAPPRSEAPEGQSSSRDTQIDLSPPPDDMMHEGADTSDVSEFHSYDPHKAMKNVEVGDFYFKRKNYKAAESRYAEALEWKPNDAIATFRLATAEEQLGKKADALRNYQAYLKLLPQGEFAEEAKSGIDRVKQ